MTSGMNEAAINQGDAIMDNEILRETDFAVVGVLNEVYKQSLETSPVAEVLLQDMQEESAWKGSINVGAREAKATQEGDTGFNERLSAARETLPNFFRQASKKAPTRCIDGRPGEDADPEALVELGPQVPGGTVGAAISYRATKNVPELTGTLNDDLDEVATVLEDNETTFGGHTSDHHGEGDTGCGAIDKAIDILRHTTDIDVVGEIQFFAAAIFGEDYDHSLFTEVVGSHNILQSKKHAYLTKDQSGDYAYKTKAIEKLNEHASTIEGSNVECLVGPHNEADLVLNFEKGTTFDRDAYSASTDGEFQAFNYDVWRTIEVAEMLFPDDARQQSLFIYSRATQAVATAMILTDGSLNLSIRR